MKDNAYFLILIVLIALAIIGIISTLYVGAYYYHKLQIDNFQKTIANLSDEQKCMHICGFQYPGSAYFDQYKFCLEKCDRISERLEGKNGNSS